jgi:hypothetical protein
MLKASVLVGLIALALGACATEHRTVVVASEDACTRYGFTASTADYVRCQQLIADQRRVVVVPGYSESQRMADSQAACAAYGVPRATAQYDRCVQDEFAARRPG